MSKSRTPGSLKSLTCELRRRRDRSPTSGELLLTNTSTRPVTIPYHTHLYEYLDLLILNSNGQVVSQYVYGAAFPPGAASGPERKLVLSPGETSCRPVHLFGNMLTEALVPDTYTVQAIFTFPDCELRSEPLTVEYPGEDRVSAVSDSARKKASPGKRAN